MEKIFVAKTYEIRKNKPKKIKIGKYDEAVVFKTDTGFFAVKNRCPHAGASLHDGQLEDNILTCIWHGWKFDLESGSGLTEYGANLKKYEILVEAEDLFLLLPQA